jgi:hypothetical protein
MGGLVVKLTGVAIVVGEVELNEAIPMNVNSMRLTWMGVRSPVQLPATEEQRWASKLMLEPASTKGSQAGAVVNIAL